MTMTGMIVAKAQTPELAGSGRINCQAWWLAPASQQEREKWLLDYWSGLIPNELLPIPKEVASNLREPLDEMRQICERAPSTSLVDSAARVLELARMGVFNFGPPTSAKPQGGK
jgi:hypothetical protein